MSALRDHGEDGKRSQYPLPSTYLFGIGNAIGGCIDGFNVSLLKKLTTTKYP